MQKSVVSAVALGLALSLAWFWLACLAPSVASAGLVRNEGFSIPTSDTRTNLAVLKSAQLMPRQCVCPMVYDPVCGRTNGNSQWATYTNSCQARCAGATEIKHGRC